MSREIISYADKAGNRLAKKLNQLVFYKFKKSQVAVAAVARELAGFVWGLMSRETNKMRMENPRVKLKAALRIDPCL